MPRPGHFTPGKDPVPTVWEAGWASEPVRMGAENIAPTGIRSLECPARNKSLYQLSYPDSACSTRVKSLNHHKELKLCQNEQCY